MKPSKSLGRSKAKHYHTTTVACKLSKQRPLPEQWLAHTWAKQTQSKPNLAESRTCPKPVFNSCRVLILNAWPLKPDFDDWATHSCYLFSTCAFLVQSTIYHQNAAFKRFKGAHNSKGAGANLGPSHISCFGASMINDYIDWAINCCYQMLWKVFPNLNMTKLDKVSHA